MTVIATDGKSIAADRLAFSTSGLVTGNRAKITRLEDGRVAGCCGTSFDLEPFVAWLDEPDSDFPPVDEDFLGLVLRPDGAVLVYNAEGRAVEDFKPTAIGSGASLAIGAMEAGASPRKAVEIASRRSTTCGGGLDVFERTLLGS